MSLAVQVTNPYYDGMTLTGAMLQSEFSTLIAKVNNLDNDNINASAGILITKTELGAATRSANHIGLQNTKKIIFKNASNADDASIQENASNQLFLDPGTDGNHIVLGRHIRTVQGTPNYQNCVMVSGVYWIAGNNTSQQVFQIPLGITFANTKFRSSVTLMGRKSVASGAPTDESTTLFDLSQGEEKGISVYGVRPGSTSTVSVTMDCSASTGTLVNTQYYVFQFIVIGQI